MPRAAPVASDVLGEGVALGVALRVVVAVAAEALALVEGAGLAAALGLALVLVAVLTAPAWGSSPRQTFTAVIRAATATTARTEGTRVALRSRRVR
jgi:uncharacterized membrane protein